MYLKSVMFLANLITVKSIHIFTFKTNLSTVILSLCHLQNHWTLAKKKKKKNPTVNGLDKYTVHTLLCCWLSLQETAAASWPQLSAVLWLQVDQGVKRWRLLLCCCDIHSAGCPATCCTTSLPGNVTWHS